MAEILGIGCTHRPLMMRPDKDWSRFVKVALDDPDMPEEWKDRSKWPAKMQEELADDFGEAAAGENRAAMRSGFAATRKAIDEFDPDVIIMWGDDQLENFREDLIPPFAVMAYEDQEITPWVGRSGPVNQWGEGPDFTYQIRGHREAGKHLAAGLIEAGFDMPYAYTPRHDSFPHAFKNTVLLLDDERTGFDYPIVPFHVNSYGRRVIAARGLRLPLAMRDQVMDLDPPSPNPSRCMEVGAAAARIMADSPWRTVLCASSSWSHSFLTEKHYQLWPDVDADKRLYKAMVEGDYDSWRRYTTDDVEDAGHHELLNWFCLLGAMEQLGRTPDRSEFIESYAFVSCVVFAEYNA